jgi:hypothetical protein
MDDRTKQSGLPTATAAELAAAPPPLARHILPASSTMIGICTTLIGLVKILEGGSGASQVDECGAIVGAAFLLSAVLSYLSIRLADGRPSLSHRCERVADVFFLLGLVSLVAVAALFAFEVL